MTTWRVILLVLAVITDYTSLLTWIMTFERTVGEVNSRLPIDQRLSHSWWYYGKYRRLCQHYGRLFPDGISVRRLQGVGAVMAGSVALAAFAIGLGLGPALLLGISGGASSWFLFGK